MKAALGWMAGAWLCLGVAGATNAPAAAPPLPPPTGTFSGEGLTLTLSRKDAKYFGTAKVGSDEYELSGTFDAEKGLAGTFIHKGATFNWSARVDGRALKFETGGSEYSMLLPAAEPAENPLAKKPAAENPLIKKPTETPPAKPMDAKATSEGLLKFRRLSIKDPGINNIEAISFLVPDGWKHEGGVTWFPDHSILANLLMTITDPVSGGQIQLLPAQNFTWIDDPTMAMQPGTNYMGNIVGRPVATIPEFIRTYYAPQALPHLQQARQVSTGELRSLAQQVSANYGGQARVMASKVRYEYERNGKPWEEEVFVCLVFNTSQGMTIWSVNTGYAFRAPKGELDALAPRMATTVSTARISQEWFGGYMYVQQLFMNRMNQGIKNAAAISATVTKNSEEIRQMFSDSYRKQQESQDRISRGFGEYIRGVQTYQNPFDSRSVELPSGYRDAWVSASGEYILSTQAGFDPNVGATTEWRRLGHAP